MSVAFRPAVRDDVSLLIAVAGSSGSGKTYSALQMATGIAAVEKRPIYLIDTEARRAKHYAGMFEFLHYDFEPPFRPSRFHEVIDAAAKDGAGVIVVDSMSDEYEGIGGLVEWAAELEAGGKRSPSNWIEPKVAHRRLMNRLRQLRCHVIFCLRAEERVEVVAVEVDGRKKTVVRPIGWQPVCEKRFMYDMTASFVLEPSAPGLPKPIKLQEQHKHAVPLDRPLCAETGRLLAEWARGGTGQPAVEPDIGALLEEGQARAEAGTAVLQDWWSSLTREEKLLVKPQLDTMKEWARQADMAMRPEPTEDAL